MAQERERGCLPPLGALFRVVLCGNVFLCALFRASCYGTYSCVYTFSFSQVHLYAHLEKMYGGTTEEHN